jgi:hypothetical protein
MICSPNYAVQVALFLLFSLVLGLILGIVAYLFYINITFNPKKYFSLERKIFPPM